MSDQQKIGLRTINKQRWEAEQRRKAAAIAANKSKGVSAMHRVAKASQKQEGE